MLRARCQPSNHSDPMALDVRAIASAIAVGPSCEHVSIDRDGVPLRLDIVEGSAFCGAVRLEPAIALDRPLEPQVEAVRRVDAVLRGRLPAVALEARLARLVLALRALDALAEGASQRIIANGLLGEQAWPGDGEWAKSWTRRVIALAGTLRRAGPRGVLRKLI